MMTPKNALKRNIRPLESADFGLIANYFSSADAKALRKMGVEPSKLPMMIEWHDILSEDLTRSERYKKLYYLIWEIDGIPVGHSNLNQISYGKEAFLHFHIWYPDYRRKGYGKYFLKESLNTYFPKFQLKKLLCEPYALNLAPNKTLASVGFSFIKEYEPKAGWINFPQKVSRWVLNREIWLAKSRPKR